LTTDADFNCSYMMANEGLIASPSSQSQLVSCDGRFVLVLQNDGNLVLNQNGVTFWSSMTAGLGGTIAAMQSDGNFVIYTAMGRPVWATNTWGQPGASLVVQDDGNLVIYNTSNSSVWASITCCR
jgi:hypothetical protein